LVACDKFSLKITRWKRGQKAEHQPE